MMPRAAVLSGQSSSMVARSLAAKAPAATAWALS
eukprot:CAMPEP_0179323330 /NCGR_PEP_ID=MMETSP0797-20121207/59660_1 /TAXON_ID=47934 /ORGANISM="Dinophysis acuminata, Strain DAEP01" /LENGTH=33 /DNA_ID= /DNA_START= /DNA_END= /DNA_ORIENTATION=